MTPLQLWCNLTEAGFTMRLEDGRLMVAPASKLTAAQREAISRHKPGLITILLPWRTTHLGLPAALLEVDAEGVPWYSTWRPIQLGPLCVPCMVRQTMLDVSDPFDGNLMTT